MDTIAELAVLSDEELKQITGYSSAGHQLDVLHKRGFSRAYRDRTGRIILERAHYLAVCRGEFSQCKPAAPSVNLSFLSKQ